MFYVVEYEFVPYSAAEANGYATGHLHKSVGTQKVEATGGITPAHALLNDRTQNGGRGEYITEILGWYEVKAGSAN